MRRGLSFVTQTCVLVHFHLCVPHHHILNYTYTHNPLNTGYTISSMANIRMFVKITTVVFFALLVFNTVIRKYNIETKMQCPQSQTIKARNANHSDLSLSRATYFPFYSESSTSASPSHTSEASSNHTLYLTQKLNEDVDEESLHAWLQKQRELQRNIRRVCGQYGEKIKVEVDTDWLIYEPKHKLLFCRNNKVIVLPPADQLTKMNAPSCRWAQPPGWRTSCSCPRADLCWSDGEYLEPEYTRLSRRHSRFQT